MFKSFFKVLFYILLISFVLVAYQVKGYVEFRFLKIAVMISVGQFALIIIVLLFVLFHFYEFLRYVAGLSSTLKRYWLSRQVEEAERNLAESISFADAELYQEAFHKAKKAKNILKESGIAAWSYARLTSVMGSVDDAAVLTLISNGPLALSGYKLRIERMISQGNYSGAIDDALSGLKLAPASSWFLNTLFDLYVRLSDFPKALDVAKSISSYGLASANHKIALCYFLISLSEEDFNKKAKILEKAVSLDKASPNIVAELAKCYIGLGAHKKAQDLIEGVWIHTRSSFLGELFVKSIENKNSDEKLSAALGLLKQVQGGIEGYVVVVKLCLDAGFLQKARYYLEKAIQANKGMSFQLLDLRIRVTQADSAEKIDFYSWLQQASQKTLVEFWECSNCGFKSHEWSDSCAQCKAVDSYFWNSEHEVAPTFYAIQKE